MEDELENETELETENELEATELSPEDDVVIEEGEEKKSPSLVINFYTWATPIVGVLALLIGLVGGYFLYPTLAPEPTPDPGGSSTLPEQAEAPQPTVDPATRAQLMEFLLPQVRHFRGEPGAPVTLIEFSDFQ